MAPDRSALSFLICSISRDPLIMYLPRPRHKCSLKAIALADNLLFLFTNPQTNLTHIKCLLKHYGKRLNFKVNFSKFRGQKMVSGLPCRKPVRHCQG